MMKNKKAWLRIVEAFIAILLIATVILYIYPQINKQNTSSEGIYDMQKKNWDFKINICKVNEICNDGIPLDKDVFVSESLISATVTDYPGKTTTKIRFFIWRR